MKKIDTHVHTSEVSACGVLTAAQIAGRYVDAGYDAIVITDHLLLGKIMAQGLKPYEIVERQLKGYLAAREAAADSMEVFLGAEIRFTSGDEDFLLFGLDEQKYFELARLLPDSPRACYDFMDSFGGLIYQAHPFRPGLHPADPAALHGVEIYNGNPRHNSHNDEARMFAERHHLRTSSGSDAHQHEDVARGGIYAPDWVRTGADLARFMRETTYPRIICDGKDAQ